MRRDWTALPESVTDTIARSVGGTPVVTPASCGNHAEIAATVAGLSGTVFVKAATSEFSVRALRYEMTATKAIHSRLAPAVEWHMEADGWLVVGFEHLDGAHADLSPGSVDLDLLGDRLRELERTPATGGPWFDPRSRVAFSHPEMDGGTLVHSDLNPTNLIVTADGLRIVDWAYATKGAPWLELALLAPWLIGSGHTPEQAEAWLSQLAGWTSADPKALDHFAFSNAEKWATKARQSPEAWMHDLAAWNGEWAAHRRHP
jgi:hypothetical protein